MPGQKISARYIFRAYTAFLPTTKSWNRRDIRRVITPYLDPGENIELGAVLYSGPPADLIQAIRQNRGVQVYYAAVTGQRVLMVEVSQYLRRPRGLAVSDPRQGASLLPRTRWPAEGQRQYVDVQYRGPSGQARTLWYNGQFEDEVGRQLLGIGPAQHLERHYLTGAPDRDRILRRDRRRDLWIIFNRVLALAVVVLAVWAGLYGSAH